MQEKLSDLRKYISDIGSVIVAFSGGVDSTFLLKVSYEVLGKNCIAGSSRSSSVPSTDVKDADDFVRELGVEHLILNYEETDNKDYKKNPVNRCFYCKDMLYGRLKEEADLRNIDHVLDGLNASDDVADRHGVKAANDHGILSPLREVGLKKDEIRILSEEFGIKIYNKPSSPCLASRVYTNHIITNERLIKIDNGENYLRNLGLTGVRLRYNGKVTIEIDSQHISFLDKNINGITLELNKMGFPDVNKNPRVYKTGSANKVKI